MQEQKIFWLRSSSLKELFDCPYRWYGNNVLKIRRPTSFKGHVGTSVHKALEYFDKARMGGDSFVSSSKGLEQLTLNSYKMALSNPKYEVRYDDKSDVPKMTAVGISLIEKYIAEISPLYTYTHVEMKCKTLSLDVSGIKINLTGNIDRIYKNEHGYGIADVKTGVMAVNAKGIVEVESHKPQLGVYEVLAENTLNIPIDQDAHIIGMQTSSKARVAVGVTRSAREVVLGTEHESGMIENAAKILKAELFYGNPSSMMCSATYCPMHRTCRFRGADAIEIKEEADEELEDV